MSMARGAGWLATGVAVILVGRRPARQPGATRGGCPSLTERMRRLPLVLLAACGGAASIPGSPAPAARTGRLRVADGTTDTYRLIDGVLGGDAVETPDCRHPAFGPHITQAADAALGKSVFVFHAHVTPDDDRCGATDRQRVEIKTYGPSPDYLKAFPGDTTTYRWRFRLDEGFRPSPNFTHVHQLEAGDGDDDAPIVTLTPRAGTPERMQLIHVGSTGASTTVVSADLAPFRGAWVEAHERVTWGAHGTYSIEVRRLSAGAPGSPPRHPARPSASSRNAFAMAHDCAADGAW